MLKCDQAINNLAATDENKLKIVDAGALPYYVKLLSPERDESEQKEAARGLWTLAFTRKDAVIKEPGCLEGHCFTALVNYTPRVTAIITTMN